MKKSLFIMFLFIVGFSSNFCSAQTLGSKKNVTLKVIGYQCGDNCGIELKDINTGKIYSFDNIDEETKDHGILERLQNIYYENGESDKKFVGNIYKAVIEFRKTKIYREVSSDEAPVYTGKKKSMWMINSLTK